MLAILFICLSFLLITISYLKQREKSHSRKVYMNPDILKYFNLKNESVSSVVLQKALLLAATTLEKNLIDLNKEKNILEPLHNDRIISEKHYSDIKDQISDIEMEKKEILAEAQELKEGWEEKIFEEARRIALKSKKEEIVGKSNDDALFMKKKEVLRKELMKRLEKEEL